MNPAYSYDDQVEVDHVQGIIQRFARRECRVFLVLDALEKLQVGLPFNEVWELLGCPDEMDSVSALDLILSKFCLRVPNSFQFVGKGIDRFRANFFRHQRCFVSADGKYYLKEDS